MGMYTGLRCHVKLKNEYISVIQKIMDSMDDKIWANSGYEFLDEWSKIDRSNFIPNGAVVYMPWNINDPEWEDLITIDGEWKFQCSLKNYEEEIEYFFEHVLTNIIEESYHIEYFYEEWNSPNIYQFIDGEIKLIKEHNAIVYDTYGFI